MTILLLLWLQFQAATKDWCEQHLIADDPYEAEELKKEINKLRLLSPEYFRGKNESDN